ncbi:MAG: YncE family protein [Actinomycetota bacterium]
MFARVAGVAMLAAVWVLAPPTPAPAATVVVARPGVLAPAGLAYDDDAHRLYVAGTDGLFTVFDAGTYEQLAQTDLTCCLDAVAVNATTHRAYVSGNGVVVYDGMTDAVVATVTVAPGAPQALAVDEAANRVYVALPATDEVAVIDGLTNMVVNRIPTADEPKGLAVSGSVLYVAAHGTGEVQAIDAGTEVVLDTAVVPQAHSLAFDPIAGRVAVARDNGIVVVLDATSLDQIYDFVAGATPRGLVFNPVTHRLWVTGESDDSLTIVRSTDGIVLGRIGLGDQPGFVALEQSTGRVAIGQRGVDQIVVLQEALGAVRIDFPLPGAFVGPAARIVRGVAPPGATVGVYEGINEAGRAIASVRGDWAVTIPFAEGPHSIYAIAAEEQSSAVRDFTVDLTPPGIAWVFRTPTDRGIWNRGPVTTRFNCTDALSGPRSPVVERTNFFPGANQTATGECRDIAGNRSTLVVPNINIDGIAPSVLAVRTPPANMWGWHRLSPVTVKFTCVDTLSGMEPPSGYQETVAGDTPGRIVRFACRDNAGNVRNAEQVLRIDLGVPQAALDPNQLIVLPGQQPVVVPIAGWIQGTATDSRSGPFEAEVRIVDADGFETIVPAACSAGCGTGTIRWRVVPPSLPVGIYQVSARANDYAGNLGPWSAATSIVIVTTLDTGTLPGAAMPSIPPPPV